MMKFDKLGRYLKGDQEPVASVDMKKASHIREYYPKLRHLGVRELMNHPVWKEVNTNGHRNVK